jgi:pimeloyl-ACP methyl ester carboxylesterase
MNLKKIIRIALISLTSLLVIATAGLIIWSKTSTYPAREVALAALESTDQVVVSQENWITFTPAEGTKTGLVFYPGGLVEPTAYAPVLNQLAAEGFQVVITPMPLNLAIFNTGAASAVLDAFPEIDTWILTGHSLGGAAAGIYAENNSDRIDALVLWDSYPPDSADLSDNDLTVLSIYGTTDNFPNTDNFDEKRDLLPSGTIFTAIEGASHAQFGDYGPQKGDVVPSLSLADQHQQVVEIMLEFIRQIQ